MNQASIPGHNHKQSQRVLLIVNCHVREQQLSTQLKGSELMIMPDNRGLTRILHINDKC